MLGLASLVYIAAVAAGYYSYNGHLMRVDDGVLEVFSRSVFGSKRIPLEWVCVSLESGKHDQLRVEVGMANVPGPPFYSRPTFRDAPFNFDIPATEEATLRAFLDDAARSVGRSA